MIAYYYTHTHTHTCFLGVSCCAIICVVCAKESAAIIASVHLAQVSCASMLTKYMPHEATDLLCGGCLFITMKSTPGGVGLTGQRRPQNPGAVQEHNPRGQQAGCLQPPRGHRDEREYQCQHQGECDEEDIQATAGMWGPELVECSNDDEGATVADECADDEHPPHVLLQPIHRSSFQQFGHGCMTE